MADAYVIDGARTPIGSFGGSLKEVSAPALLEHAIRGTCAKVQVPPDKFDEIIAGQVMQGSDAPNIARFSALRAGLPHALPGLTLNRQCASGLEAALWGAKDIVAGEAGVVMTAGVEAMSSVPYVVRGARWGLRMGPHFLADGISELYDDVSAAGMWIWAEYMAEAFDVSRAAQDEWALLSHRRALAAVASGQFMDEIYPIEIETRKGSRTMDRDEAPRPDTSAEALAALEPRWKFDGTVTPGNSSPLSDGACVTVLASGERAREVGFEPLARIVSWAVVGVDPEITGYSPVHAIPAALKKANLELKDVGLFEINEAFAVMIVTAVRELGLDPEKVNLNGGAIALGHPVGMSGNRLLLTLSHGMKKRGVEYGVVSLCAAGGLGIAAVLQNAG